ncbi:hypothetical protein NEMBOFW57_001406 [Staphylotrichum longicolle]|uniref:Uncharacterized protein n=1 Tax=Staphylotrichum longicolle TaxID=669026 RepID=A0AAD4F152_9PEZI|nr:hypothetical protein NEMBOFW57_001406 [Staphylotrichum longicolle]
MASTLPPDEQGAKPNALQNKPQTKLPPIPKVSSSATFMSLVRRVRKALEKAPSSSLSQHSTKGLPLAARIAALKVARPSGGGGSTTGGGGRGGDTEVVGIGGGGGGGRGRAGVIADALDDVVLVATGRAIERAVDVGGFFTREKDLVVLVRTRTVRAVDDVVAEDEEADVEDQVRVRGVSCVEVGIRWVV